MLGDILVDHLTPSRLRSEIEERGALVIRGAVDHTIIARLRKVLLEILDNPRDCDQHQIGHVSNNDVRRHTRGALSLYDPLKQHRLVQVASRAFRAPFLKNGATHSRRIDPLGLSKPTWDAATAFHVDAEYHRDWTFSLNFWTPLDSCGVTAPGLEIAISGPERTKKLLAYDSAAPHQPDLIVNQHKFDRRAFATIEQTLPLFAPKLEPGDMLVFTNYTLHRTYLTPAMTEPRTSIEIRVDSAPVTKWMLHLAGKLRTAAGA